MYRILPVKNSISCDEINVQGITCEEKTTFFGKEDQMTVQWGNFSLQRPYVSLCAIFFKLEKNSFLYGYYLSKYGNGITILLTSYVLACLNQ